MKKLYISTLMLCGALFAQARLLEVTSTRHVNVPEGYKVDQASVSPDGTYLIISSVAGSELTKLDLATGAAKVIAANGSNYDLKFTPDSKNVVFREITTKDNRRYVAVKSVSVADGKVTTIAKPSRNMQGISVDAASATVVDNGRARARRIGTAASAAARPAVSIEHGQLCLTTGGDTRVFSPLGTKDRSYIWASVSPDASKVLFYVVGDGCYVCGIDGSDIRPLGVLRAPVWYDDNTVVGMVNETDGYVNTASRLVASSIDGKVRQTLTDPSLIALFPTAGKGTIAFSTQDGEAYILNVK